MKRFILVLAMGVACSAAYGQQIQGQGQIANSNSDATSNSASQSGSASNQAQQANNAGNAQNITFNTPQQPTRTSVDVKTNTPIGLVAAVSYSSDYCGGVGSAGASAAGISIGASKPLMDRNCQAIRRAQTFGMLSANAHNLGNQDQANRLMAMSIYEICESGLGGTETFTQDACLNLGLVTLGHLDPAKPLSEVNPAQASPQDLERAKQASTVQQQQPQQRIPDSQLYFRDSRGNILPVKTN